MILCVTLNPCIDRTVFVDKLELDKIIAGRRSRCIPGGKGNNVARVLNTLGVAVDSLVLLGGHTGRLVEDLIREQDGITPITFWVRGATREVVTAVEERSHRQIALKEPGSKVTPAERKGLIELFRPLVERYDWVVFSGTVPCPALDDIYAELIALTHRAGVKSVLDSSGEALRRGLAEGPFLAKLNLEEAGCAVGHPVQGEKEIWQGIGRIRRMPCGSPRTPVPIVAVTAGKDGAYVASAKGQWRALPPPVRTVNPVGSGDSFLAGMIAGLANNASMEEALRLGMAAGAANAAVWDAATFTRSAVEKLLPQVHVQKRRGRSLAGRSHDCS
jgi:1-phosphofructokinase family hexose kinase